MWVYASCKSIFLSESGLNSGTIECHSLSQLHVLNSYTAVYIGKGENSVVQYSQQNLRPEKQLKGGYFSPKLCSFALTVEQQPFV